MTVYFSLNQEELSQISRIDHDEAVLYLVLKKLADFKTGKIGEHPKSKTNYEKLAEQMSRPSRQGKSAVAYDRKDIERMLKRMQLYGLVILEPFNGDDLMLTLPMSPMKYGKKVATAETAPGKEVPGKLPQQAKGTPSPSPVVVEKEPSNDSLSVLTTTDNTINTTNTLSIGWGSEDSEEDQDLFPSVDAIIELMASRKTVNYVDSDKSKAIYQRWVMHKVKKSELMEAIQDAEMDFNLDMTPDYINAVLRERRGSKGKSWLVL